MVASNQIEPTPEQRVNAAIILSSGLALTGDFPQGSYYQGLAVGMCLALGMDIAEFFSDKPLPDGAREMIRAETAKMIDRLDEVVRMKQ